MLQGVLNNNKTRWHAFYTWCFGGFHIGRDLGQGILNFLPQGFIGMLLPIEKDSKLFELPKLLNLVLGTAIGIAFAVLALIPAVIEGIFFKRPYKKQNDQWSTALVDKYGVKMLWGSFAASALWLMAIGAGYIATSVNLALVTPLALSYAAIALTGVASEIVNIYGSMMRLYVYRTKDLEWQYKMTGLVNIMLESADAKESLNKEFRYETEHMSRLFDEAYAQLVQQTNQPPNLASIHKLGVLTHADLEKDQSDFLTQLTKEVRFRALPAKLTAIEERHKTFETKYRALA